jgi:hypothetical protein
MIIGLSCKGRELQQHHYAALRYAAVLDNDERNDGTWGCTLDKCRQCSRGLCLQDRLRGCKMHQTPDRSAAIGE